jgi:hypothetical protein
MSTKTLRLTTDVAEFLLDLPEGTTITDVSLSPANREVTLTVDTEHDFPDDADLVYATDEFGNIGLTGANPR